MVKFKTLVTDHTPYAKRRAEVENSTATVCVDDYDGSDANAEAWTSIEISEQYTLRGKCRIQAKTVHVTLNPEQRKELLGILLRA